MVYNKGNLSTSMGLYSSPKCSPKVSGVWSNPPCWGGIIGYSLLEIQWTPSLVSTSHSMSRVGKWIKLNFQIFLWKELINFIFHFPIYLAALQTSKVKLFHLLSQALRVNNRKQLPTHLSCTFYRCSIPQTEPMRARKSGRLGRLSNVVF